MHSLQRAVHQDIIFLILLVWPVTQFKPIGLLAHQTLSQQDVKLDGIFQDQPALTAAQLVVMQLPAMMELSPPHVNLTILSMEMSAHFAAQPTSKQSIAPHQLFILHAHLTPISKTQHVLLAQLLIVLGLLAQMQHMLLHALPIRTILVAHNVFNAVL